MFTMLSFLSISTLIGLIPVTINGIGTRDASLVILFATVGVAGDRTVTFSLMHLFFGYLTFSVIGGLFYMQEEGRKTDKKA